MSHFFYAVSKYMNHGFGRMLKETGLALDAYGSTLTRDIAYLEPLSRHRKIMPLWGKTPVLYSSATIADNATLVGEVVVGDNTQIGYIKTSFIKKSFGVVARADEHAIRVGHNCNIGDNTIMTCSVIRLPSGIPHSVNIGNNVNIGDSCILNSCIVDDNVSIGSRTLVMDGSQIERGAIIEQDSVVPPGRLIPANQVWGGNPVFFIRDLNQVNYSQFINYKASEQSKIEHH